MRKTRIFICSVFFVVILLVTVIITILLYGQDIGIAFGSAGAVALIALDVILVYEIFHPEQSLSDDFQSPLMSELDTTSTRPPTRSSTTAGGPPHKAPILFVIPIIILLLAVTIVTLLAVGPSRVQTVFGGIGTLTPLFITILRNAQDKLRKVVEEDERGKVNPLYSGMSQVFSRIKEYEEQYVDRIFPCEKIYQAIDECICEQNHKYRMVVLESCSGFGKTCIVIQLLREPILSIPVYGFFFCNAMERRTQNATIFVKRFGLDLSREIPELLHMGRGHRFLRLLREDGPTSCIRVILKELKKIAPDHPRGVILIDALNESFAETEHLEILKVLKIALGDVNWPKWLQVLATSTQCDEVSRTFDRHPQGQETLRFVPSCWLKKYSVAKFGLRKIGRLKVKRVPVRKFNHLTGYAKHMLNKLLDAELIERKQEYVDDIDEMAEVLARNCHYNFLFLDQVLTAIEEGVLTLDTSLGKQFPVDIKWYWLQALKQQYPRQIDYPRDLIELIVASNKLPEHRLKEVYMLTSNSRQGSDFDIAMQQVRTYLAKFEEPDQVEKPGGVTLCHSEFQNFVVDGKHEFTVDRRAGHARLFFTQIKLLQRHLNSGSDDEVEEISNVFDSLEFPSVKQKSVRHVDRIDCMKLFDELGGMEALIANLYHIELGATLHKQILLDVRNFMEKHRDELPLKYPAFKKIRVKLAEQVPPEVVKKFDEDIIEEKKIDFDVD